MPRETPELAAFILAGGRSVRMGTEKALVSFQGRRLIECMVERAHEVTPNVRIVGSKAKFAEFAPVVEDIFRECGPLGGIHAALRASAAELNLMLAVDMPFVSPELLRYLVERARSSDAIVTVPGYEGRSQPLCAVYRSAFADTAENALENGRYKIDTLFAVARTDVIREDELKSRGFEENMFRNLNTPEELRAAQGQRPFAARIAVEDGKGKG
jgi:molybdopterin-guanine dinucleotide biosynthesis protein A